MTRGCCESGLLRYVRNDKGGVAAHDKGVLRRALQGWGGGHDAGGKKLLVTITSY